MMYELLSKALFRIEDFKARLAVVEAEREAARAEVERLREDAARARWCEEMRADVRWNPVRKLWVPQWWKDGVLNQTSHPDRNAAIDAAMKGGK